MFYKNLVHESRFKKFINGNPCKVKNEYIAAVYLVSADKDTWCRMRDAITDRAIDFSKAKISEIGNYGYLLLRTAQDIYDGTLHIDFPTLCDPYIVSNKSFELIMTALRIARYGYGAMDFNKKFN